MKVADVIFALIVGRVVGFVVDDFLKEWGINLPFYEILILWIVLPFLALFCLWLASIIGRKFLFLYQAAKHVLVGAFATVIDLKVFELFLWLFSLFFTISPIASKSISFIVATSLKYIGNKYWVFQKHEREDMAKEVVKFVFVLCVGLVIDVSIFYYLSHIIGPQFNFSETIWIKISVLCAAVVAAIWNFLGEKFFVFKK